MSCESGQPPAAAPVASHTIRPARAADAVALAAIDADGQVNPWSEAQFAVIAGGDGVGAALVCEDARQVVGYVVFARVLDEASLHRIAVHRAHRGRGLGQALLRAAMEQLRRDGASRCLLEVRQSNAVARRLYEGNGFRLDGVRKNYYPSRDGREDAVLMSRTL